MTLNNTEIAVIAPNVISESLDDALVSSLHCLCHNDVERRAMAAFLNATGCTQTADLTLLDENDVRNGLPKKVWQQKVLLLQDFIRCGGSVDDVTSLAQVQDFVQGAATKKQTATVDDGNHKQAKASNNIIRLNVGGHLFTTTRKTLCKAPFFESLLSGRFANTPENGTYFIDRDGGQFAHILNYLRVGALVSLPSSRQDCQALAENADYYGLGMLVKQIQCPKMDLNDYVTANVAKNWQAEAVLRGFYSNGDTQFLDTYQGLQSLFAGSTGMLPLVFQPLDLVESTTIVMQVRDNSLQAGQAVTVKNLREFESNFNKEHPNLLSRLSPILLQEPVILAGGSVLRALTTGKGLRPSEWWESGKSDIDLFIHGTTSVEASRIARRIFYALAVDQERWFITRSTGLITMQRWVDEDDDGRFREITPEQKIQVVLRLYDSPAEVLIGFDVDCCGCAFDGKDVWATPRCLLAIQTGVNIVNPIHAWPNKVSYEMRLAKYANRGYVVAIPGLAFRTVDEKKIRTTALGKLKGLARLLKISFDLEKDVSLKGNSDLIHHDDLKHSAKSVMTVCEQFVNGYWGISWDDEGHQGVEGMIIPVPYREGGRVFPVHWKCWGYPDEDAIPRAIDCRDGAWTCVENAADDVSSEGVPDLLEHAWMTEKRSREYLNAGMDKIDLDSLYYDHACKKAI